MSKRKKIIPSFKELKEDMKDMSFKEKADHIWTYYKGYLLGVLFVGLVVAIVITGIVNSNRQVEVCGILVNGRIDQKGYNYLTKAYAEALGKPEYAVELQASDFQSMEDPTSSEDNMTAAQKLILLVASGEMDYAIVDQFALNFYLHQDVFSNLDDVFPAEMLEELAEKDMLMYYKTVDEDASLVDMENDSDPTGRIPIAIKMQDLPFVQDTMYGGEYYFCATSHEPDTDAIIAVWNYILAWENK